MSDDSSQQAVPDEGAASPRRNTEDRVFHIELDISLDYRKSHEAFVILDALEEYASRQRWLAEDGPNAEFQIELAETADRLHALIDAQMGDANVREAAQ